MTGSVWQYSQGLVPYPDAISKMESAVEAIRQGLSPERIWCLQHPSLFTAGTSAQSSELLDSFGCPVYQTGRGGKYTYHGPGQLILYVMINLRKRQISIRDYVHRLESWAKAVLFHFSVPSFTYPEKVGLWVKKEGKEEKIASIGIRVTRGITWHGLSLNVSPDLSLFKGILPCGLSEFGVTSLKELGVTSPLDKVQDVFKSTIHLLLL